jgi:hypothetical protein
MQGESPTACLILAGRVNFADQSKALLPSNYAHVGQYSQYTWAITRMRILLAAIDMCPISIVRRIQESFPADADKIFQQRIRAIK